MHCKRSQKPTMVAPNLLQPSAEIESEYGPSALIAEINQPANDRSEGAKIQRQKKSGDRRHRDRKHDERHRAEPVGADKVEHDAEPAQHEYQQAYNLDENV